MRKHLAFVEPFTEDPAVNLAYEELLLDDVEKSESYDAARVWVNERCLVVGRGGKVDGYGWFREDLAARLGLKIYRRSSGGGAVYHDKGNLNWTVIRGKAPGPLDLKSVFLEAAQPMLMALRNLGIEASFAPPNRLEFLGSKISGMAAHIRRRAALVHGTLLIKSNLEELNMICTPPPGSPPVMNLGQVCGNTTVARVIHEFKESLEDLGCDVVILPSGLLARTFS